MKPPFETNVYQHPDSAVQRLLRGERLFFPGIAQTGLGGYIRRRYGLFEHSRRTEMDGQLGILVWVDDQPTYLSRTTRKPYRFTVVSK